MEERLSSYLLGDLTAAETAEVKAHLDGCPACQATVRELAPTLAILRETLSAESASAVAAPAPLLEPARRLAIRDAQRQARRWRFGLPSPFRRDVGSEEQGALARRHFGLVLLKTAAIAVVLLGIAFLLLPYVGGRKSAVPAGSGDVAFDTNPSRMPTLPQPEVAVKELAEPPAMPAPPAGGGFAADDNGRLTKGNAERSADSTGTRSATGPSPVTVALSQAQEAKASNSGKVALGTAVARLPPSGFAPAGDGLALGDVRKQREGADMRASKNLVATGPAPKPVARFAAANAQPGSAGAATGTKGLAENGKDAQQKGDRDNVQASGATGAGGVTTVGQGERISRSGEDAIAEAHRTMRVTGPAPADAPATSEPKKAKAAARPQRNTLGNAVTGDGHVAADSHGAEGKRLEGEKPRASGPDHGIVVNGTGTTVTVTGSTVVVAGGGEGGTRGGVASGKEMLHEKGKPAAPAKTGTANVAYGGHVSTGRTAVAPSASATAQAPAPKENVPVLGGRLFGKSETAPAPPSALQLALVPARAVTAPAKPPAPGQAPVEIDGALVERQDAASKDELISLAPGKTLPDRKSDKGVSEDKIVATVPTITHPLEIAAGAGVQLRVENGAAIIADESGAIENKPTPPTFETHTINPFIATTENVFSTFSMDVDTASYTMARRAILEGRRPPPESIRVEEFINSFDYVYQPPTGKAFAIHAQSAASAFRPALDVLEIGVKASRLGRDQQRRAVLTLLIDTSGSMNTPDRLSLVKRSLKLLVGQLKDADSVAIVQFATKATLVLEPTPASERARILEVIDNLQTAGSTHLEAGMRLAYETAARAFVSGGSNRVLLLSDGVANLGAGSADSILKAVESFRKQGIYLSVFGFGSGSYNDAMLQNLADKGDGAYVFIDSLDEAKRVLVDDLTATLNVMASDAKIQVEFNPKRVVRYRQIGYEKRQLTKEQFRDDTVDAAEIGPGQSVTALYEVELQGGAGEPVGVVRIRYRNTDSGQIEEIDKTITSLDRATNFAAAPVRYRLAAGVAEFAEVLRGSPYVAGTELNDVAKVLRPVALDLRLDAHIQELLRLVQAAASLPGN